MANWNRSECLKLINFVKKYPCLYDTLDPKSIQNAARNAALEQIRSDLQKPDITALMISRKFRNLKCQFNTELKRQKKNGKNYEPVLWCYKELLFLKKHIENDTFSSNKRGYLADPIDFGDTEDSTEVS